MTDINTLSGTGSGAKPGRRRFLKVLGASSGLALTGVATVPFVKSLGPSQNPFASGLFVAVDLTVVPLGEMRIFTWKNHIPIMVIHRTQEMIDEVAELEQEMFHDTHPRRQHPEWLIVIGICTHLGCIPSWTIDQEGPFWCECHGSQYGYAGERISGPAPRALDVPPHVFTSDSAIIIGTESLAEAGQFHVPQTSGQIQRLPANRRP